MKLLLSKFKQLIIPEIIIYISFFILSVILVFPQLFATNPNLIDDGGDFQNISQKSFISLYADQFLNERFRPVFYFYKKILFFIFGFNIYLYFFFQAFQLSVIFYLFWILLKYFKSKNYISFIVLAIFTFLPSVWINIYRLGTDELTLTIFLLLTLYLILKNKYIAAILFYIAVFGIKETVVFTTIPIWIYLFINRKWNSLSLLTFIYLAYFYFVIKPHVFDLGGYLNYFPLNFKTVFDNIILIYYQFPTSFISLLLTTILSIFNSKKFVKNIYLIFGLIISLLPQFLIYRSGSAYYLLPLNIFTLLLLAINLNYLNIQKIIYKILLLTLTILLCIFYLFPLSKEEGISWHRDYIYNGALVEYLLKNNFSDREIYVNILSYEMLHKTYIYASHFIQEQIIFYPPIEDWLGSYNPDNELANKIYQEIVSKYEQSFFKSNNMSKILISDHELQTDFTKYKQTNICSKSPFISLECRYYIYEPL